jgi:hypothetical protein
MNRHENLFRGSVRDHIVDDDLIGARAHEGRQLPVDTGMHSIAKRSQSHPASVTACSGSEPNARTVPPTQNHTTPAGFPSCFIAVMAPYCHFPANQTVAPKGKNATARRSPEPTNDRPLHKCCQ